MTATATHPANPPSPEVPTKRSWLRRISRRAGQAVAVLTVLALIGAMIQAIAERRDAVAHPAPGELVELSDGRQLHLQVAGEEHAGPTVVLEGGAGASTPGWGWILPAVAEHATVVAYDRAGLGWSDPSPSGRDADPVIADLRDALATRGLPGPYVLVGHSLGAHYTRAFAEAHPDEVAGIVLVDPSHERAAQATGIRSEELAPMAIALRAATRLGLTRVHNPFDADIHQLPQPQRDQALAHMVTVGYARTFGAEMVALDRIGARLPGEPGALGDVPLRVLIATGGASDPDEQAMVAAMADLREGLAALSTRGETIVLPDASHVTIVTEQAHAQLVTDAIVEVTNTVR